VRRAVRAHLRLSTFKRQLAAYQAARRRGLRGAALGKLRPAWFAPDKRGRYAWALRELEDEYREAWPRIRRRDGLQTHVWIVVQHAILQVLQPEGWDGRGPEHGRRAKSCRLADKLLRVYFPTLFPSVTPKRLKDRRGLLKLPTTRKTANP
jgi:hypothetical protein